MKIEVDVIEAEQSWNFDTRRQQHFLVIEVFGIRTRVPCSEEELVRAIVQSEGGEMATPEEEIESFPLDEPEDAPRPAPSTFVPEGEDYAISFDTATGGPGADIGAAARVPAQPPHPNPNGVGRRLAPLQRPRGDDVGIAQG